MFVIRYEYTLELTPRGLLSTRGSSKPQTTMNLNRLLQRMTPELMVTQLEDNRKRWNRLGKALLAGVVFLKFLLVYWPDFCPITPISESKLSMFQKLIQFKNFFFLCSTAHRFACSYKPQNILFHLQNCTNTQPEKVQQRKTFGGVMSSLIVNQFEDGK